MMSKRNTGVDLARIIATMLIVLMHVLGCGGILRSTVPGTTAYWAAWFLEIFAFCAVNVFAMVSGYVMTNKEAKLKRIFGLWFQASFYSIIIGVLFFAFVPETRTLKNILVTVFPVLGGQWWYLSSYFALFLFVPILNVAIEHISPKVFRNILLVVLLMLCTASVVFPGDTFLLNGGYSAFWLIIMYLFGAYIKKYEMHTKITASKSIFGFFIMTAASLVVKMAIYTGTEIIFGKPVLKDFVSYTSVTVVLAAVFLLLFCLNLKVNKVVQKAVGILAPVSLGVYLIHVHPFVYKYILGGAFKSFLQIPVPIMVICTLLATVPVYLACAAIEWLRIQIFKLIHIDKACVFLENKITSTYAKIFKEQV